MPGDPAVNGPNVRTLKADRRTERAAVSLSDDPSLFARSPVELPVNRIEPDAPGPGETQQSTHAADRHRRFLFLQGPLGPFFRDLTRTLEARGHRVIRVAFHGGDAFDGRHQDTAWYRGSEAAWPEFVVQLARHHDISDVVLLGDARPMHLGGVRALKRWRPDLRVHVFEEGYVRPDWLTLEANGVNGWSQLPKDPRQIRALAQQWPSEPEHRTLRCATRAMGWHAIQAYAAMLLLYPLFRRYRHHRPHGPLAEAWRWLARLVTMPIRRPLVQAAQTRLHADSSPKFLVLLQLETDKQIRVHSPYPTMRAFLTEVLQSFAAHAAPDAVLVVKAHPLDCTAQTQGRLLRQLARALGVETRVHFLDGGHLPTLLKDSVGAITINSTAGLSALHHGVPLLALGEAVYKLPGLTHQSGLDPFWRQPQKPDADLYHAFRRVTLHLTQINGGFYTREGIALAVESAANRLSESAEAATTPATPKPTALYPAQIAAVSTVAATHEMA